MFRNLTVKAKTYFLPSSKMFLSVGSILFSHVNNEVPETREFRDFGVISNCKLRIQTVLSARRGKRSGGDALLWIRRWYWKSSPSSAWCARQTIRAEQITPSDVLALILSASSSEIAEFFTKQKTILKNPGWGLQDKSSSEHRRDNKPSLTDLKEDFEDADDYR